MIRLLIKQFHPLWTNNLIISENPEDPFVSYDILSFASKDTTIEDMTTTKMVHLRLIPYLLLIISIIWLNSVLGKKVSTLSPSQVPVIELNRPEIVPISQMVNNFSQYYNLNIIYHWITKKNQAQYQEVSNPTIRASSFMVDPLIIIALIALPTIGMLGVSSLIMPLIPIGIYLIQVNQHLMQIKKKSNNLF